VWGTLTEHNSVIFHNNDVSAFVKVFMVCIDVSSSSSVPTVKPITPKKNAVRNLRRRRGIESQLQRGAPIV
jgi:hypothetical protein